MADGKGKAGGIALMIMGGKPKGMKGMKDSEGDSESDSEDSKGEDKVAVAEEIIRAIKDEDAEALSGLLEDHYNLCM